MTDKTPEALADLLEEQAQDHLDVALSCDMRPEHTANWAHMVAANEAAALLRRQHQRIQALEKWVRVAILQGEHDMVLTGEECRAGRALLSTTQQEGSQS